MSKRLMAAVLLALSLGLAHAEAPLSWEQLGEAEQQVLKPYAGRWDSFTPEQQLRLQKGAARWQEMDSAERAAVRERFERWQQMPAEQKQRIRERYQEYQSLPAEQQQRIRKQMELFREMPEGKREQLLQRWQAMSAEEREAVRRQMRAEADQKLPAAREKPQIAGETAGPANGASQEPGSEEGMPAKESEAATLPAEQHGGRFRDNRMDRRTIETPMRRQR